MPRTFFLFKLILLCISDINAYIIHRNHHKLNSINNFPLKVKKYNPLNKSIKYCIRKPRSNLPRYRMGLDGPGGPENIIQQINSKQIVNPDIWSFNEFKEHINTVKSAVIVNNQNLALFYDTSDSKVHIFKYIPSSIDSIVSMIVKKGIDYQVYDIQPPKPFELPFIVQLGMFYIVFNIILRKFGGNLPMNPLTGSNNVNLIEKGQVTTKFVDVAGLDEAKEELEEIVDYLQYPLKYLYSGARVPKGVLLEGPPGTGKTLMARAVAGEANVSFISASGSEFIEMFVGVGAQRVRKLFEEARNNKPCVIFIDEIDAVGGRRGYGFNSGGNDEREQTLNQILTNMDGFEKESGIIVLAATNRADTLDPALKRAGRFDRKININLPDLLGRKEIAKIHFRNKPNVTVNMSNLAELTAGFSGADIENLANEAALLRVRENKMNIDNELLLRAFEKITVGLPKKYEIRSNETLELVAFHEIGHALLVKYYSEYFQLQKVTLKANTGGAGGYTLFTPKEPFTQFPTKGFVYAQIIVALGGRAAEMILYDDEVPVQFGLENMTDYRVTVGASNDLERANEMARQYILLFGNYLVNNNNELGEQTKSDIDTEVNALIDDCLRKAKWILNNKMESLYYYSEQLMKEKIITF